MVERPHGHPEQEAAVVYLVTHWKSFRLQANRLRRTSVPLTELYDECIGVRTTLWGPGVGFKAKGLPLDMDSMVILVPQDNGQRRIWYDLNHGYQYLGRLIGIGMVRK